MGQKSISNRLKDETGQNLIEFALVVPMLLLLVFGIAEFGRAWMTKSILTGAAREAGCRSVLVKTGYGENALKELGDLRPDHVAENLLDAAEWIVGEA